MNSDIKDIFIFNPNFWKGIGVQAATLIKDDALNGIMQDNQRDIPYKSKQYMDYKSRFMQGKKLGRKIKPYNGVSVINNDVSKVNMTLTGATFRNLLQSPVAFPDNTGVTINFNKDADKVGGNQDLGRDLVGLRPENQEIILDEIMKQIDENIKNNFEGTIEIYVK